MADGVTKWWVAGSFRPGESVPVLGDLVRLTYVVNPGAAFGLQVGPFTREIFTGLALVASVLIVALIVKTPAGDRATLWALALILGGAVGNLVDRIGRPAGVVDFMDVGVGALRWPVFNLADVGVTTGAVLLVLLLRRNETGAVPAHGEAPSAPSPAAPSPGARRLGRPS